MSQFHICKSLTSLQAYFRVFFLLHNVVFTLHSQTQFLPHFRTDMAVSILSSAWSGQCGCCGIFFWSLLTNSSLLREDSEDCTCAASCECLKWKACRFPHVPVFGHLRRLLATDSFNVCFIDHDSKILYCPLCSLQIRMGTWCTLHKCSSSLWTSETPGSWTEVSITLRFRWQFCFLLIVH